MRSNRANQLTLSPPISGGVDVVELHYIGINSTHT